MDTSQNTSNGHQTEDKRPNVLDYAKSAIDDRRAVIERDPFPYLVVENILPADVYAELEANFPSIEYVAELAEGEQIENNTTYLRTSDRILADPELPALWRTFVETNTSAAVFETACAIWKQDIESRHPGLEANFGKPLESFETARRHGKGDSEANRRADLMLDCQFGINSPVRERSTSRGPHVDRGAKLFSALLYFRDPADASEGGEYELYRLRRGPFPQRKMKKVPDRYIECVRRIPYRANALVMWLNTPDAVHGVAPRSVTTFPRRYIAISGECFGGARPSAFFSHFPAWDTPLGRLRSEIGLL